MVELDPIEIEPSTFLKNHFTLPALPQIISQIQKMIESDDVDINKVSDLISKDPALVAQILKIVNSAYYSLPQQMVKVKLAVAYLGIAEIQRVILSISVFNILASPKLRQFDKIWFHSLYTALCAKYFSQNYEPHLSVSEIWTASILHDIGKMVYLKFFPAHYNRITKYQEEQGCLFSEAAMECSLPSSTYLGNLLCDHWRLPKSVKDVCANHSLSDLKENIEGKLLEPFTRIILLGNLMAIIRTENLNNEKQEEIIDAIKSSLNIGESEFNTIIDAVSDLEIEATKFMT